MYTKQLKGHLSLRIEPELKNRFIEAARRNHRHPPQQLRKLITDWLNQIEQSEGPEPK